VSEQTPDRPAPGPSANGSWERLSAAFQGALERPPEERDAFLREALGGDEALLARVRRLLKAHEEAEAGDDPLSGLASGLQAGRAAALLRDVDPSGPGPRTHAPDSFGPSPGDEVGRYRVLRRLGQGGMGAVYEAHDPTLDRSVALKFLPPGLDDGTRLLEEARAASALDHPCIGTVYEVGEDAAGRSFIAMASYSQGTLRERLRGGPLPVEDAVRIAVQVADALDAAHSRGILHRDVKPENLLFDDTGRVKVVDFGIARALGGVGSAPAPPGGTAAYMSPEQVEGGPMDGRSDLWSLGVVLFEMLTGERPFQGGDRAALLVAIREGRAPDPRDLRPELDPALAAVVSRALAHDPRDRFPTGKALAGGPPGGHPPGARPGRCLHRSPGTPSRPGHGWNRTPPLPGGSWPPARTPPGGGPGLRRRGLRPPGRGPGDGVPGPGGAVRTGPGHPGGPGGGSPAVGVRPGPPPGPGGGDAGPDGTYRGGHGGGSLALEVAERAGAGAVLETTVARAGTRYVLSSRALEARSGEELFAVRTSAAERGLLGAVERLSREVRMRLGEASESLAESRPLPQVTTASLEALRLYAMAERAMGGDGALAPSYLEAALELDPGFAMAHRMLAATGINRMRFEVAVRHLQLAWEHRDRLPDRERWLVEAARASETEYQPYRAEELYERIVARFPDEFIAWANLGNTRISWLHDPEGALDGPSSGPRNWTPTPSGPFPPRPCSPWSWIARSRRTPSWPRPRAPPSRACGPAGGSPGLLAWGPGGAGPGLRGAPGLHLPLQPPGRRPGGMREHVPGGGGAGAGHPPPGGCPGRLRAPGELPEPGQHPPVPGRHRPHPGRHGPGPIPLPGGGLELASPDAFGEPDRYIYRSNLQIHAAFLGFHDVVERLGERYPPLEDPDHLLGRGGEHLVRAALAVSREDGTAALTELEGAFPPGIMALGWRTFDELLRGLAFELLEEDELAATHFRRAMNRGWAIAPGLTKDRINILVAEEGLARVEARMALAGGETTLIPEAVAVEGGR
jgi:hypothetical protein